MWRAFELLHLAPLEKSQAQAILPSNNLGYQTCIHTKNVEIPWIFNNDPKDCLEAQIENEVIVLMFFDVINHN